MKGRLAGLEVGQDPGGVRVETSWTFATMVLRGLRAIPPLHELYCAVSDQCFAVRDRIGGPVGDVLDAVGAARYSGAVAVGEDPRCVGHPVIVSTCPRRQSSCCSRRSLAAVLEGVMGTGDIPSEGQMNPLIVVVVTVELMVQPGPTPTTQLKLAALYSGLCSR